MEALPQPRPPVFLWNVKRTTRTSHFVQAGPKHEENTTLSLRNTLRKTPTIFARVGGFSGDYHPSPSSAEDLFRAWYQCVIHGVHVPPRQGLATTPMILQIFPADTLICAPNYSTPHVAIAG